MGIACTCRTGYSEDETLTRIFNTMNLRWHNCDEVYADFINCINNENQIDKNMFNLFLSQIVNRLEFRSAQVDYFQNLLEINGTQRNGIKRIGIMIIFLSEGGISEKTSILTKHINKYYGKSDRNVKDFISDLVDLNTDICLLSFKQYLDDESYKEYSAIWKKQRKQKYIIKMYKIYEEVKATYSGGDTSLLEKFLTMSYNNLTGEYIRSFLNESYLVEGNNLITNN